MVSDVIFLDDNTPCENKFKPEVKLSSIKFLTKSFTKKGFSYSIKNGILYKENKYFDFTGLVDFEGAFHSNEISYQLFYSARFLEGKLSDRIELSNFLIVFNKESSMQNFLYNRMKKSKQKKLEAAGWKVCSASEFLELNKESSMQNFFNLLVLKIKKWMIWKK